MKFQNHCLVRCWSLIAGVLLASLGSPVHAQVLGTKPAYTDRSLSTVPNAAAFGPRIWAPGLDEGYVPQGMAFAEDSVIMSSYRGTGHRAGDSRCRVYRIHPATGIVTGQVDLPASCTHAGGAAYAGNGRLFIADTHVLLEVPLAMFGANKAGEIRLWPLGGRLRGSFLGYREERLWIGEWNHEREGTIAEIPLSVLDANPGAELTERHASRTLRISPDSQGAAFDAAGMLWLTQSNGSFGQLQKVDPRTGVVSASYVMPDGIEDIAFDSRGGLWTVVEAGSQRWLHWSTFFPLVFGIDVRELK
jgi:hypothetical protein